jgi:uncharacterized membrane protein
MKGSTATALRANVVLFSVSTAIAMVPCVGVPLLFGLLDDGTPALPRQGGIFVFASLVVLLLRWNARRAFYSALQAKKVRLAQKEHLPALIAGDCPRAWLVQLHLELRGFRCGE